MIHVTAESESLKKRIKELEDELDCKQQDMEKFLRFFIANVSHEIRTPLNAILGFSNLLSTEEVSSSKKRDFIKMINSSSDRLIHIVDNLLELSQIQNNQLIIEPNWFNLRDLLFEMYQHYNYKKYISNKHEIAILYSCHLDEEERIFYYDDIRLKQVLEHLLDNALKFTKKGIIEFGCIPDNNTLQFFVRDSGIGIPDDANDVFKSFVKYDDANLTDTCGIGVGLSICKGIVDVMKGKIWYETNVYNGTTFFVNLPLTQGKNGKIKPINEKNVDNQLFS